MAEGIVYLTEEESFLARISHLPVEALLPTEADEAEARALIYDYRQAENNQLNTLHFYKTSSEHFINRL